MVMKSALKERSSDAASLAKATTMTKEQWQKHQVGMKEKWAQPTYMADGHPEGKGHTCYRDETFEIVTRWHADTKISYRPHAKAPGSKSHVRYESYSKATTVGQALKKGTFPQDWCWDYERGYIKVHGPVREDPIDIASTANDKDFTDVDRAVYSWYRKELAKKLGLKLEDLRNGKGSQESTMMRAHRLVAQRESKKVLAAAEKGNRRITDAELTGVLKEWAFARNSARVNVMQKDVTWVWSDTMGLLRDRTGDIHLTQATKSYPEFVQVVSKWLTDRLPKEAACFKFTSLNLNKDYNGKIHRDGNNFGPSMISAFGDFSGGKLNYYPDDDGSEKDLSKLNVDKIQLDLKNGLAMFNGNCAHAVDDFEGNRFSIVYFTMGCHAKMKPEDRKSLENMGIPAPELDEDPFSVLRPPLGRKNRKAPSGGEGHSNKPSSLYWPKAQLCKGPPATKTMAKAGGSLKFATATSAIKKAAKAASGKVATKKAAVTKKIGVKKTILKSSASKIDVKGLPSNSIITRTDKPAKTTYIDERLKKVMGSTVDKALGSATFRDVAGNTRHYRSADLKYDIQCGYLSLGGA